MLAAGPALKDLWDKLRVEYGPQRPIALPSEEEVDMIAPLRDDDPSLPSYSEIEGVQVQPRSIRPTRHYGFKLSCALFCKALGLLVCLYIFYGIFKFARWYMTPAPTGLENMPPFGTQLSCDGVMHYYLFEPSTWREPVEGTNSTLFRFPIDEDSAERASFSLDIIGRIATGTLVIERQSDPASSEVHVLTSIHSPTRTFDFRISTGPTNNGSYYTLEVPDADTCVQYELVVRLPLSLRDLKITTEGVTQIKFGDNLPDDSEAIRVPHVLRDLSITMADHRSSNLLLTSNGLVAETTKLSMAAGYLTGSIPLMRKVDINMMPQANAVVAVKALNSQELNAVLETHSGSAPFRLSFENPEHRRCLNAMHQSRGDIYLDYSRISPGSVRDFMGEVEYTSKGGYSVSGVPQSGIIGEGGCDKLHVNSGGWLKLVA